MLEASIDYQKWWLVDVQSCDGRLLDDCAVANVTTNHGRCLSSFQWQELWLIGFALS